MLEGIQQRFEADLARHTVADVLQNLRACTEEEVSTAHKQQAE